MMAVFSIPEHIVCTCWFLQGIIFLCTIFAVSKNTFNKKKKNVWIFWVARRKICCTVKSARISLRSLFELHVLIVLFEEQACLYNKGWATYELQRATLERGQSKIISVLFNGRKVKYLFRIKLHSAQTLLKVCNWAAALIGSSKQRAELFQKKW